MGGSRGQKRAQSRMPRSGHRRDRHSTVVDPVRRFMGCYVVAHGEDASINRLWVPAPGPERLVGLGDFVAIPMSYANSLRAVRLRTPFYALRWIGEDFMNLKIPG
jgi:hypothetical protein